MGGDKGRVAGGSGGSAEGELRAAVGALAGRQWWRGKQGRRRVRAGTKVEASAEREARTAAGRRGTRMAASMGGDKGRATEHPRLTPPLTTLGSLTSKTRTASTLTLSLSSMMA
ncbi:Os03g0661850 [Oryza sativa Japonica Group]|uniref:Os03g0661850 protein n=1 Tax=Oryza sativa subsp. japonica TaxID=39947 RepID=A0A0P0W127_ORYSJ|nr:Os03g0661850 [Oryza sativa Japonica Group]